MLLKRDGKVKEKGVEAVPKVVDLDKLSGLSFCRTARDFIKRPN
jgi:hypothetical protein